MFLNGRAAAREIVKLVEGSQTVRLAVAFWGVGATDALGLGHAHDRVTLICNLKMGGTNPHEIRRLQDVGVTVLQKDDLHSKVYIGDYSAIVGSSNASANGLSMQAAEQDGWIEANVLVSDPDTYRDIVKWFEDIQLNSKPVSNSDLEAARTLWRRRRSKLIISRAGTISLYDAVRAEPESFADRNLYVFIYRDPTLSDEGEALTEEHTRELGDGWESFEDWGDIPEGDALVFYYGPRGGFYLDGCCRFSEPRHVRRGINHAVEFARTIDNLAGFAPPRADSRWREACRRADKANEWDDEVIISDLGEFGRRYLT